MPDLFSPCTLTGVTLRNRTVMSPNDDVQPGRRERRPDDPRGADRPCDAGRPALANPLWPIWAARKLGHASSFPLVQQDGRSWLENFRGHAPSIGWPEVRGAVSA
jgi:2,4-dienoyl-CoA reductase-like NADH-dependent reductase (Old Yellow Enzyme family)